MAEHPEPKLREQKRTELRWDRQRHRKAETDVNRAGLGEMLQDVREIENLTCQDIKGLASRIKRRKHADAKDLLKLSYGFQQSAENISEFVRITGAINVLVKEFTGHDTDLQQLAGECLCNLSLGDEVCCEKVAVFAGTYLITFLDNKSNMHLMNTCLWTLQNMISSGIKPMKVLHSQGVTASLNHLLEEVEETDLLGEILLTLELILDFELEFTSKEHIISHLLPIVTSKVPQVRSLKLIYNCLTLTNFETLDTPLQIIQHCIKFISTVTVSNSDPSNTGGVLLCTRMLANLIAINDCCGEMVLHQLRQQNIRISDVFNLYSKSGNDEICRELLWFLGNVHKETSQSVLQQYLGFDNFINELIITKQLLE